MKIVILVEWYHPIGGIEAFVWRLVKHLNPNIHITLAVCFVGPRTTLESSLPNLEIVDVSHDTFSKVQRLTKQKKPDLIHTNHISLIGLAGYWAGRKQGIPIVVTNHQVPQYKIIGWERFTNPFVWLYVRLLDKRASVVTAPSPTVAQLLNQHGIRKNVRTISCGVNTDLFRPREKEMVRQQIGIDNRPTLLFVGRIAKDKNIELLLKATALLKAHFDFQVLLVGPKAVRNDASQKVEQLISNLGIQDRIKWLGFLPTDSEQLALHYAASDAFVIPSFFETQSIATLEAMASGLPIVGSNSGALPDLVKEGINGFLFHPLDEADLAEKLRIFLEAPGKTASMGKQSRLMVEPHNIKHVASQYEATYKEVRA